MRSAFPFKHGSVSMLAAGMLLAAALAPSSGASAYTLKTLYSFCVRNHCKDGDMPFGGVLKDHRGTFYGVTSFAGANWHGTVFKLVFHEDTDRRKLEVLYSFCPQSGCSDGDAPNSPLIMDVAGNLYGTAGSGGANGGGVVFELMPNAKHEEWTFKVLHDFCAEGGTDCTDGKNPFDSGVTYAGAAPDALYDGVSPLYGATAYGGNGGGVVYELKNEVTQWRYGVLHRFCPPSKCSDGATPDAPLLVDAAYKIYGTTVAGGPRDKGTVFELIPNAARTDWSQAVLYNFCSRHACADGASPRAGVMKDASGNLYGTAEGGGAQNRGVVFKLAPGRLKWHESVLYSFCALVICIDGAGPSAGVLMDAAGNLYGTTVYGGDHQQGAVFKLSETLEVLHSFCAEADCTDGWVPRGGVTMDGSGNLFGVTQLGGTNGGGTVYRLSP